ncbi:tripartite tricarboxylate transporter TctB family protein [Paracoccus sp. Z330]|uniref:Tripartite tricarboxylate transporter TctB family protein n=1 Tax=Paracoccus onchidii TaxID=3017813 RepID=A0ABT4ZDE0_9RHOB|nr:tripartite tricarboxylate transporter TctB family protein [Paracoccus onchidii]MDB6176993.1 tripartite tricarboxylate transporter TctB family protein [Paracoccus onchidii]
MQRDYQDLAWGAILALLGAFVAAYAATSYEIGNLRRMGPGFFPVALGLVLMLLGAAIGLSALKRAAAPQPLAWREGLGVIGALIIFALLMPRLGVVIATALASLTSSAVAPRQGVLWRLVLCVAVTFLTWLVFVVALDMTIPVWPKVQ